MTDLYISLQPYPENDPEDQRHNLGNIVDDIWKEKFSLSRSDIIEGRYIGTLKLFDGRPLRKKEKNDLERRLSKLNQSDVLLDAKVIYSKDDL